MQVSILNRHNTNKRTSISSAADDERCSKHRGEQRESAGCVIDSICKFETQKIAGLFRVVTDQRGGPFTWPPGRYESGAATHEAKGLASGGDACAATWRRAVYLTGYRTGESSEREGGGRREVTLMQLNESGGVSGYDKRRCSRHIRAFRISAPSWQAFSGAEGHGRAHENEVQI
eukprot:IDg13394t1